LTLKQIAATSRQSFSTGGTIAATRVSDDSKIVLYLPCASPRATVFTDVVRWPVDEDRHDLSVIRNHVHGAVSLFHTTASREGFYGSLEPPAAKNRPPLPLCRLRRTARQEKSGRGAWDEEGLDWRQGLSPTTNSGYIEIQAGLFSQSRDLRFQWRPASPFIFFGILDACAEIGGISRRKSCRSAQSCASRQRTCYRIQCQSCAARKAHAFPS